MSAPFGPRAALTLGAVGIGLLTVMDAVAKSLAGELGTLQIVGLRFGLTALLAAIVATASRARWPRRADWPQHAGRAALMLVATACFFHALGRLPLVTVFALSLTAPLCIAVLAPLLLGETLPRPTRVALALGGMGAVVVVAGVAGVAGGVGGAAAAGALSEPNGAPFATRPDWFALACAVAAPLGYALSVVWLRQQTRADDAPDVTAVVAVQAACAAGLLGTAGAPMLAAGWVTPPDGWTLALLLRTAALGVLATAGYLAFAAALKRLPAGRLAVVEYTGLVWAAAIGWGFFGERPTPWDAIGAALIVAGCLQAARRASNAG